MSRTVKDKPDKLLWGLYDEDYIRIEGTYQHIWSKTTKTKKRKEVDTEWHWMGTPGWWVRLYMNRPQRRAVHLWEKEVLKEADLEETDPINTKRKPHIYYW